MKGGVYRMLTFQQPKQDRNFPLTELTEQQHREALENGFGKQVVQGYSNVIAALKYRLRAWTQCPCVA